MECYNGTKCMTIMKEGLNYESISWQEVLTCPECFMKQLQIEQT